MRRLRRTGAFERDLRHCLAWSFESFGATVRDRYAALVAQGLKDLAGALLPLGLRERPDIGAGLLVYHLRHSRNRVGPNLRIGRPRHFFLLQCAEDGDVVVLLRLLHDGMDIARHIPGS